MPTDILQKERRVHPRYSVQVPIDFWVLEDLDEIKSIHDRKKREKHLFAWNISLEGMCIMTEETLKCGKILSLEITVPDAPKKIKVMGEVVWSNETAGGVQFLTMQDADMESWEAYLGKVSSCN